MGRAQYTQTFWRKTKSGQEGSVKRENGQAKEAEDKMSRGDMTSIDVCGRDVLEVGFE